MVVLPIPRMVTDKDLPCSDGKPMENLFESPQSMLLTVAIEPVLDRIHGEGQYLIGADSGIYWRLTNPPLDGCKAPDWYFVPDVPQAGADGNQRRSYLMFNEQAPPYLVIEYVSGDGSEEHDRTENSGKFWVYERAIRAECYAIFDPAHEGTLEVYERVRSRYRRMQPNERGHYEFPEMEAELGIWHGSYRGTTQAWLRFYDPRGRLLANERDFIAERDQERERANNAEARAAQLAKELAELKQKLQNNDTSPKAG